MKTPSTPQEISEYKMKWKPGLPVKIHSDMDWKAKDWCRKTLERHQWSMDQYTGPYEHTFRFEHEVDCKMFKLEFKEWVI